MGFRFKHPKTSSVLACLLMMIAPSVMENALAATSEGAVFSDYSPLAGNDELARRLLTPLTALRLERPDGAIGTAADARIDLDQERFALHVPPDPPPAGGYALLVFVPPWETATVPRPWVAALDGHAMIFVTAAHSGNDEKDFLRREPLALLAATNVMKRYPVDRDHVYVGGFSGGSRVALRLAVGYPDVFHGAVLDAGSDAIGGQIPPPPADLFQLFQEHTRLVYLTGQRDPDRLQADARSQTALADWCVFDVASENMPWAGHQLADAGSFAQALDLLMRPTPPDQGRIAACRANLTMTIDAELGQLAALIAGGKRDEALAMLQKLDLHDGGLAMPRLVELARRLGSRFR